MFYGWDLVQVNGGLTAFDPDRLQVIDYNLGLNEGDEYGLFPMIIGGFFLYASYYGCDQTQAQRLLSAKDEGTTRKLLLANGLLRFPIVLVYCIMGLIIGALVSLAPDFSGEIARVTEVHFPEEYAKSGIKPDLMIPVFILKYLPHGVIGILMIGIMSAAMSSLSSTINSLSAVTVEDFFNRGEKKLSDSSYMRISKLSVIAWGIVCIGCAFLFGGSDSPVIEIINAIGSVFYGPVLATFVLAIFSKKVNGAGMKAGIVTAVFINLIFSKTMQTIIGFDPGFHIFWMWLNFTGFVLCVAITYMVSSMTGGLKKEIPAIDFQFKWKDLMGREPMILIGFFIVILAFSYAVPSIFG